MIKKSRILNFPIKLSILYLFITLFLYLFGPFAWKTNHPVIFWALQITYLIMMLLGYAIGLKIKTNKNRIWQESDSRRIVGLIKPMMVINVIFIIINLFRSFGFSNFDFASLCQRIIFGLNDMGAGYNTYQSMIDILNGAQVIGGYFMSFLNLVWDFLALPVLILSCFYFKRLNLGYKLLTIVSYILTIISYVSIGTNIGVFRIIMLVGLFCFLKMLKKSYNEPSIRQSRKKFSTYLLVIIGVFGFISFFVNTMKSRGGILLWETSSYNVGGVPLNRDSLLLNILPDSLIIPLITISGYLTQGYYGFSLSLLKPWKPTFGIGNCKALMNLIPGLDSIYAKTYQYRITEYGWDDYVQWHTMYTWFANDVSFLGVIVIMFLLGLLLAVVYRECLESDNPFAPTMLYYLAVIIFFIPCNNQVFQSTGLLFSFLLILALWLCTRKRKIKINKYTFI